MSTHLASYVIWFRLGERLVLTASVLFGCGWLAWKYVGEITKIDLSSDKLLLSRLSVTIGTPILIGVLFVGYTYIDLTNRIEFSTVPQVKRQSVSSEPVVFRGLNDDASQEQAATQDQTEQQLLQNNQQAFTEWIEKDLQRVFLSLVNKAPSPAGPGESNRDVNLALAVGCLNSEAGMFRDSFDHFTADKNFQQIQDAILRPLKSHQFVIPLCRSLKQEY